MPDDPLPWKVYVDPHYDDTPFAAFAYEQEAQRYIERVGDQHVWRIVGPRCPSTFTTSLGPNTVSWSCDLPMGHPRHDHEGTTAWQGFTGRRFWWWDERQTGRLDTLQIRKLAIWEAEDALRTQAGKTYRNMTQGEWSIFGDASRINRALAELLRAVR